MHFKKVSAWLLWCLVLIVSVEANAQNTLKQINDQYGSIVIKANKAYSSQKFAEAEELYLQALKVKPGDSWCKYQLKNIGRHKSAVVKSPQTVIAVAYNKPDTSFNTRASNSNPSNSNTSNINTSNSNTSNSNNYAKANEQVTVVKPDTQAQARTMPQPALSQPSALEETEKYEHILHIADSTAWIAKDHKAALRWYDSARILRPAATYPGKQIAAVRQILHEKEVLEKKRLRTAQFNAAMADYKKAESFRLERNYPEAYKGYSGFLAQLDTLHLNEYPSAELHYINQAKDFLARLQQYKPQPEVIIETSPADKKTKKKKKRKQ